MKWFALSAAILLAFVAVRGSQEIDHGLVIGLYDEKARAILDGYTGGTDEADEPQQLVSLRAPQNDGESGNCSKVCEGYECEKDEIPDEFKDKNNYLFYERQPIECRLGARVFLTNPKKATKFLNEDLWDCCRRCNLQFYKCLANGKGRVGVLEKCLRSSYTCMCTCLRQNPVDK